MRAWVSYTCSSAHAAAGASCGEKQRFRTISATRRPPRRPEPVMPWVLTYRNAPDCSDRSCSCTLARVQGSGRLPILCDSDVNGARSCPDVDRGRHDLAQLSGPFVRLAASEPRISWQNAGSDIRFGTHAITSYDVMGSSTSFRTRSSTAYRIPSFCPGCI